MKRALLSIYCGLLSLCSLSQTISVTGVASPSCYGQCNGDVSFSITGATGPFSVSITNTLGCVNPAIPSFSNANVTFSNMCSCQYFFTFYDGTSSIIGTQTVNITQPNILISGVSPDPTICIGQLTQIYASGSGGTPPYTYSWNPSSLIGGGPHSLSPTITTQYVLSMSDANGCFVNPKVVTISVRPPLLASGDSFTKCEGDSTALVPNITSAGNGGPYNYNWTGGATTSSIVVSPTFSSSPNTYTVSITDGCTTPSAFAVFTLNVGPPLSTSVNLNAVSCPTCCDGSAQISVSSGTVPYTVSLTPTGITTQTATGLCAGAYTYCATNSGCSSCKVFTITNSIGVKEYFSLPEVNIFPNPSDGHIKLQSSENISHLNYELFDVLGNKIDFGKSSEDIIVDVPDGVYILMFHKTDNTIVGRKKINIKH